MDGDAVDVLLEIRAQGMRAFDDVVDGLHRIEIGVAAAAAELQLLNVMNDAAKREAEGTADALDEEKDQLRKVKDQAAETSAALGILGAAQTAAAAGAAAVGSALAAPTGWWQILVVAIVASLVPLLSFIGIMASSLVILSAFTVGLAALAVVVGGLAFGFGALGAGVLALGIDNMGGLKPPTAGALAPPSGAGVANAQDALLQAQEALAAYQAGRSGSSSTPHFDPKTGQVTTGAGAGTPAQAAHLEILQDRVAKAQAALDAAQGKLADGQARYAGALAATQTPIQLFIADINDMVDVLGKAAAPFAALMIQFGDRLIPVVQGAGLAMITWFGDRLPGALNAITGILTAITPAFTAFFGWLGKFFDSSMSMTTIGPGGTIVTLAQLLERALTGPVIGAIEGFLVNLERLSKWFLERLPVFLPIINTIFGGLGDAVQGTGSALGKFVDWIVANWPATMDTVNAAVKAAGQFWKDWGPLIQTVATNYLPVLGSILKDVAGHTNVWLAILFLVVGMLAVTILIVVQLLDTLLAFIDMMGQLGDGWKWLWDSMKTIAAQAVASIVEQIDLVINGFNRFLNAMHLPTIPLIPIPNVPGQGNSTSGSNAFTHGGQGVGLQAFGEGGVVQGPPGSPQIVIAHAGEEITKPGQSRPVVVYSTLMLNGRPVAQAVQRSDYNRRRGF